MTSIAKISLKEAVLRSNVPYKQVNVWTVADNIIDAPISETVLFESLCVIWGPYNGFIVTIAVSEYDFETGASVTNLDHSYKRFTNLKELEKAYPKLFEVKGRWDSYC